MSDHNMASPSCVSLPVEMRKLIGAEKTTTRTTNDTSQKTLDTVDVSDSSDEQETKLMEQQTFWNFFCTFVFPLLVQSVFGGFYIVRTIILGYTLQYSAQLLSLTETTAMQWLGKTATPPPALLGLALLTIAAFIIHPDGVTWILLRKLRYVVGSVE